MKNITDETLLTVHFADEMEGLDYITVGTLKEKWKNKGEDKEWINSFMEHLDIHGCASSRFAQYVVVKKPNFSLNFRISIDECHKQRFTEQEVREEIKNDNVTISKGLLIRKGDGKVIGGFLV